MVGLIHAFKNPHQQTIWNRAEEKSHPWLTWLVTAKLKPIRSLRVLPR
jgi:hypothetical protein